MRTRVLSLLVVLCFAPWRSYAETRPAPVSPPASTVAQVGTPTPARSATPILMDVPPKAGSAPIYERWWFWASLAAAVCAVSLGVAVAARSSRASDPPLGTQVPLGKPLLRW